MRLAIFTPDASDEYLDANGGHIRSVSGRVEILRQLGPDEIDQDEVGKMYEVRNIENGLITHAFESELAVLA